MTRSLHVARNFDIPARDAATHTWGILGMRGAGKSNTEVVMAEEMWKAKIPWVAVDPKGDWWGIRSSVDGKGPGLALPVLGGLHGDVPLEATAGIVVADMIVDENMTCVLDVSDFSKADRARFLVDFFDQLYKRHRKNPEVRHVFMEEAHEYIPQQMPSSRTDATAGRLKEAAARIVLQGRTFGLGATVASQRSARLHNDVLTQVGTLIPMRTTAPADRKAILLWVEEHGQGRELVNSLPELADGEAWVWSPQFLKTMKRVRFRQRATFDSGATPKFGRAREPATLAQVNLKALRTAMAATIEKAKADDPKMLRQQIAEWKQKYDKANVTAIKTEMIEVPVMSEEEMKRIEKSRVEIVTAFDALSDEVKLVEHLIEELIDRRYQMVAGQGLPAVKPGVHRDHPREPAPYKIIPKGGKQPPNPPPPPRVQTSIPKPPSSAYGVKIGKGEMKTLVAIAQHRDGVTREQLSVLTGYKRSSRDAYLQRLRVSGMIEQSHDGFITASPEGIELLGEDFEPLPTGGALREHWLAVLPEGERKVLGILVDRYPNDVPKEDIDAETGYARSSRDAYIQRLKSRRLVDSRAGVVRAVATLFD